MGTIHLDVRRRVRGVVAGDVREDEDGVPAAVGEAVEELDGVVAAAEARVEGELRGRGRLCGVAPSVHRTTGERLESAGTGGTQMQGEMRNAMRQGRARTSVAAEYASEGSSAASYCLYTTIFSLPPNWHVETRSTEASSSSWMRTRWRAPKRQRPAASHSDQFRQQQASAGTRGGLGGGDDPLLYDSRRREWRQLPDREASCRTEVPILLLSSFSALARPAALFLAGSIQAASAASLRLSKHPPGLKTASVLRKTVVTRSECGHSPRRRAG